MRIVSLLFILLATSCSTPSVDTKSSDANADLQKITSEECRERGGKLFTSEARQCPTHQENLGRVIDVKCKCSCCKVP